MTNTVKSAVKQIEVNPFYQRTKDQQFLPANQVQIEAWAPFAEERYHLFENDILVNIGAQYGKSVGQVVLSWLLQRDVVALAKSTHKERIVENFAVFDFTLSDEDMRKIATLDTNTSSFFSHRDPDAVKMLLSRRL